MKTKKNKDKHCKDNCTTSLKQGGSTTSASTGTDWEPTGAPTPGPESSGPSPIAVSSEPTLNIFQIN